MHCPVERTARCLRPASTPITLSGRAGVPTSLSTSQVKQTHQRSRSRATVTDQMRAVPVPGRDRSLSGCSWVRTTPTAGRRIHQPEPSRREPPRIPAPALLPAAGCRFGARASLSRPLEYASLRFSSHQGATVSLARFHFLPRCQQGPGKLYVLPLPRLQALLHPRQTPTVGEPRRSRVRAERRFPGRAGVRGEAVRTFMPHSNRTRFLRGGTCARRAPVRPESRAAMARPKGREHRSPRVGSGPLPVHAYVVRVGSRSRRRWGTW
jgi:hypothetical protein